MSVQLVTADIVFGDSFVARPSLQRLIFIARHNYFPERVKEYRSLNSLVQDGIPTNSTIYTAAQGHFSQDPSLDPFIVGRFESKSIITPEDASEGKEYSITLNALDAASTLTASYTAVALDTQEEIVDALKLAIDGQPDIASKITTTKVGTGSTTRLELTHATTGEWFTVDNLVSLVETFDDTPENSAADELAAITLENDNFYVITTDVKDGTYVEALAEDIAGRFNFYAVSLSQTDAYMSASTGTFKTLIVDNQYLNCYPMYHHEAATKFPEVAAMSEAFAVVDTGITFANRTVIGVGESLTAEGNKLSDSQVAQLMANGINFFNPPKISGSVTAQRLNAAITTGKDGGGRVASGEYAFNVVGKDALQIEIEANVSNLLISQKNGRLTYTQDNIDKARNMVDKALVKFADVNGWNLIYSKSDIDSPYVLSRPTPRDYSAADRITGILSNISFTAYLKDAIHLVDINGSLVRPD